MYDHHPSQERTLLCEARQSNLHTSRFESTPAPLRVASRDVCCRLVGNDFACLTALCLPQGGGGTIFLQFAGDSGSCSGHDVALSGLNGMRSRSDGSPAPNLQMYPWSFSSLAE